jgi:hypothetical protein
VSSWGPLATPIHTDRPPHDENGTSWRDYALFTWWDPKADVYVMTHHMSSPDPDTPGRTRVSATVGDRSFEVIEQPDEGSYDSESITLDLEGRLTVRHPQLTLDVTFAPELVLFRRERYAAHHTITIPPAFTGVPVPIPVAGETGTRPA